jgi:hypothetical protein
MLNEFAIMHFCVEPRRVSEARNYRLGTRYSIQTVAATGTLHIVLFVVYSSLALSQWSVGMMLFLNNFRVSTWLKSYSVFPSSSHMLHH